MQVEIIDRSGCESSLVFDFDTSIHDYADACCSRPLRGLAMHNT
tara:strand:+ start:1631 stop:1762 length:132 start_codon:yes stop_codon:yes gene_type:complete